MRFTNFVQIHLKWIELLCVSLTENTCHELQYGLCCPRQAAEPNLQLLRRTAARGMHPQHGGAYYQ